jgi:hypothetical protein
VARISAAPYRLHLVAPVSANHSYVCLTCLDMPESIDASRRSKHGGTDTEPFEDDGSIAGAFRPGRTLDLRVCIRQAQRVPTPAARIPCRFEGLRVRRTPETGAFPSASG